MWTLNRAMILFPPLVPSPSLNFQHPSGVHRASGGVLCVILASCFLVFCSHFPFVQIPSLINSTLLYDSVSVSDPRHVGCNRIPFLYTWIHLQWASRSQSSTWIKEAEGQAPSRPHAGQSCSWGPIMFTANSGCQILRTCYGSCSW